MDATPLDATPPAASADARWWTPIIRAMRRNLVPGLVLQAFALALVAIYYLAPAARPAYETVARTKVAGGFAFSALSALVAAGLIPWLVQYARGQVAQARWGRDLLFVCLLWAWRGAEVDAFYRLQSWMFGDGHDPTTIVTKVLVDQFGYAMLWANPCLALCYRYRDRGYDLGAARSGLTWRGFLRDCLIVQAAAWTVWIPAVAIIYCLPGDLQFPLFAVVVCFWSLLLATVTARH